jgi:hypothetical protein
MLAQNIWPGVMDLQSNAQSLPSLSYAEHTGIDYSIGTPSRLQRFGRYGQTTTLDWSQLTFSGKKFLSIPSEVWYIAGGALSTWLIGRLIR